MYAFRDALDGASTTPRSNGRLFVNNVSLGVYATIVQEEGYRDAKVETTQTLLPELLGRTDSRSTSSSRARRHRGGRRLPHPGLQQPLRARRVARPSQRRRSTREARRRRRHRDHGAEAARDSPVDAGRGASAATGTNSPPSVRGPVPVRQGLRRRRRRGPRAGHATRVPRSTLVGLRLLVPKGNMAVAEQRRPETCRSARWWRWPEGSSPSTPDPPPAQLDGEEEVGAVAGRDRC